MCKIPKYFVNSVCQRRTAYLNAECVYVPWLRWCSEPTLAPPNGPRRGVLSFPPSFPIPKGSEHHQQVHISELLVLTQEGLLKARFKRKLVDLVFSVVGWRGRERGTLSELFGEDWRACCDTRGSVQTACNNRLLHPPRCARPRPRLLVKTVTILRSFAF